MKKLIIASILAAVATTTFAQERAYVLDTQGQVVKSGTGLCVRTGYWTPELAAKDLAGCACDKQVIPTLICEPKVAAAAAVATAPVNLASEKVAVSADTLFDFNKAVLRPAGVAKLDEVVAKAKSIKLEVIIVTGHTDRIGTDKANQVLSEKRAAAVQSYLVSKGIDATRVLAEGKGEKQPVTTGCVGTRKTKALVECLQADRRVTLEIIGTK